MALVVVLAAALLAGVAWVVGPVPQDPAYHDFADTRRLLGIANFWNVASNLPFLPVGVAGVWMCLRMPLPGTDRHLLPCWLTFFAAVTLVAAGSAYYHLEPTTERLFWDRLPMAIGFMALFTALVGESRSAALGRRLLAPAVTAGVLSVLYWHLTERWGTGDLRPYALVQFGAIVAIAGLLAVHGTRFRPAGYVWSALGLYLLAKVAEHFDATVLAVAGIGGHAFKHLLAAAAAGVLLLALRRRHGIGPANVC